MSVGPKLFNCFGCDAGGDVLKWLQLKEKLDFPAAVARLQELASQFPASASEPKRIICPENHQDEMRRVAELYRRALLESQPAQDYLKSRGLESRELWNTFQIGYADGVFAVATGAEKAGKARERLKVLRREPRLFSNLRQHCGPDLFAIVEREAVARPAIANQNPVGTL